MKCVEINAVDDIDSHQWRQLWVQCSDATVFQRREWMRAWTAVFAPASNDVKLITAWDGERLVGLAPLARFPSSNRGGEAEWSLLGDDYSDYQTFLAWDDSPRIVEALIDAVDRCLPHAARLALRDVPQFSTLGMELARRGSRPGSTFVAGEFTACPTLRIRGNKLGVERVLGKSSLRRSERGLQRLGQLTIEHSTCAADIQSMLPGLFSQHMKRWSDTPHPSLFLNADNQRFYQLVVESMQGESTLLYTSVHLNKRVVAQHFGLQSKESLLWYKPAFDIDFRQHSPGDVLIQSLIRYAREHDCEELDFTRGDETFKSRFASLVSFNRSFVWHRRPPPFWRPKLVQAKSMLRGLLTRADRPPERLGGMEVEAARGKRALILDAHCAPGTDFALSLSSQGIEVHVAGTDLSSVDAKFERFQQPAADDSPALVEWLVDGQRAHQYSLIVPGSAYSTQALAALPQSHRLRSKCLLYGGDSSLARRHELLSRMGMRSSANSFPTDLRTREVCILALYIHGRMISFFIQPGDAQEGARVQVMRAAKRVLDALGWHGPATVRGNLAEDEKVVLTGIEPFFQETLRYALQADIQFPLYMWRAITAQRVDPQISGVLNR
jgi:CelD/BcsL family acetyltransferase involved in cellulose biosynthesis